MTLKEFFMMLDKLNCCEDVIVKLAYKYDWEKEYTITNEFLEYCVFPHYWEYISDWNWLNDWNEGQQDVKVLGYTRLRDVNVPIMEE